ncbi:hypothetical protein [Streptomyces fumanus]|uniref:hypothetical protein n=1 Tax=Streptomyces fumanus TaxID=67302 RepID=UPI0033D5D358
MKSWRSRIAAVAVVGVAAVTIPLTAGSASASATKACPWPTSGGWCNMGGSKSYEDCQWNGQYDVDHNGWNEYLCIWDDNYQGWLEWLR